MFCSSCGSTVPANSGFCPACGARAASGGVPVGAVPPGYPSPPPVQPYGVAPAPVYAVPAMDYATWATRALGAIIDFLLVGVGMALLYALLGGVFAALVGLTSFGGDPVSSGFGSGLCCMGLVLFPVSSLLVGFFNNVYLVSTRGYSIGQGVVHIKVVDATGSLLSMGTAVLRLLVRVALSSIPFLSLLDLLWPLWDDRRQTLHDKAVNCYVVNNPSGV
jgi:uncharacterized RDD family membrane protein YckC